MDTDQRRRDSAAVILRFLRHSRASEHRADDPNDHARELTHSGEAERRAPAGVFIGVILVMSACGPVVSTAPSPSLAPSQGFARADCPDIDLRSPLGERINLTGTWVTEREGTREGIYYLHQIGECLWFTGGFLPPDEGLSFGALGFVTVSFRGRVGTDFIVTGDWAEVRIERPGTLGSGGSMTLEIQFGEAPGDMRLVYVGGSGQPFVEPGYREEQSWVKISTEGAYPPPSPAP